MKLLKSKALCFGLLTVLFSFSAYAESNQIEPDLNLAMEEKEEVEKTATYKVEFISLWNAADHLKFPRNAHFSPIVATTHNQNYKIFRLGELATPGLERVAELGVTSTIQDEIEEAQKAENVENFVETGSLFPQEDGDVLTFEVTVSKNHSHLSFVTMIAPSPDWFVGVDSLQMYKDGEFLESCERHLYAYNAGTEEGDFAGNFSINNSATNPQQMVSTLKSQQGFKAPFAKVVFTLVK